MRSHIVLVLAVSLGFSAGLSSPAALAADLPSSSVAAPGALAAEGKALLDANCSRCHATGQTGSSPFVKAPPFRNVMRIYGADSLQEALAEGLITGHPAMPEFVFPPDQVGAIITYLHTLEDQP